MKVFKERIYETFLSFNNRSIQNNLKQSKSHPKTNLSCSSHNQCKLCKQPTRLKSFSILTDLSIIPLTKSSGFQTPPSSSWRDKGPKLLASLKSINSPKANSKSFPPFKTKEVSSAELLGQVHPPTLAIVLVISKENSKS